MKKGSLVGIQPHQQLPILAGHGEDEPVVGVPGGSTDVLDWPR
ncbi:hypothetical protein Rhow_005228 [Rhodococcus wratislaviensis]|uniref:Uncharacterized protein n=1 Tax=Rhodococcus wratislaviensis TaxID=44752 RepID=A0A402CD96_RHOWR|nr:hypothetical protein Rhow_005228 [Rhodococcus wratislaviensis]